MDQALNAPKYEWLRERQDDENNLRISRSGLPPTQVMRIVSTELMSISNLRISRGQKPKKLKLSKAVEVFRVSRTELDHIMVQPFASLTKQESIMRKLLRKYVLHFHSALNRPLSRVVLSLDTGTTMTLRSSRERSRKRLMDSTCT